MLRDSDHLYNFIFENAGIAIIVVDKDANILLTNKEFEALSGCRKEELEGRKRWTDFVNDQGTEIIRGFDNEANPHQKTEVSFTDREGKIKATLLNITPIPETAKYMMHFCNISEQIEIEDKLQKSENLYRAIVEDQTEMICRWRPDNTISFVNDAYCRYYGLRRDNVLGKKIIHHLPEDEFNRLDRHIAAMDAFDFLSTLEHKHTPHDAEKVRWIIPKTEINKLEKHNASIGPRNPVRTIEHIIIKANGEIHWNQWTDRAIMNNKGMIIEFQAVGRDITPHKKTEHILKESERRLFQIINFLPDATFAIDLEGKVIAWNRAIEEMTGIRADEILEKGNYEYALPFYGERRPVLIDLVLEPNSHSEDSYFIICKNKDVLIAETKKPCVRGQNLILWGKASPIYNYNGNIVGAIESIRDITERKQTEEALRKSEKQLRFLSSQLLKAQENERKFIAQELHDSIGQILTAVKFGIENALGCFENEKTSLPCLHTLGKIIPLVQHGIMEVRRICTGLRPDILDDLGIVSTITWFCRELQIIYPHIRIHKDVMVHEYQIPETLKIVIYRILQEALNNIVKYSKATNVYLQLEEAEGILSLSIEDNGKGFNIAAALADESSKRGMGLASMKERTEITGGHFHLESREGKGTTIKASWHNEHE